MNTFIVVCGTVSVALQVVILWVKLRLKSDLFEFGLRQAEIRELLQIVKDWAYSARTHSKDSMEAMKDVRENAVVSFRTPSVGEIEIEKKIEMIPDQTADKVVEKLSIKEDSDPFKKNHSR